MAVITGFEQEWEQLSKHIKQDVEPSMGSVDGEVVTFNFVYKGTEFTGSTHDAHVSTPNRKPEGYLYTVIIVSKDSNVIYNGFAYVGEKVEVDLDKF